jgi:NTE family protein
VSGRAGDLAGHCGLVGPRAEKTVALALQGGGAHGAFTWGVLDRLLEDGRLAFEAITGASAGSMNAVLMTDGWLRGGPDGARERLELFWRKVSFDGDLPPIVRRTFEYVLGAWSPDLPNPWLDLWRDTVSPTEGNPLDLNPLRDVVRDLVDFERLRGADVKLFVAATNVWSGQVRIFETGELTADHVMASACLPTLFRAVTIEGEPYWDGGYVGNPPLYPLFYKAAADDVLLVQINPVERRLTPTTTQEIRNRMQEITFNGGLLRELRVVDFVTRLIDDGKLDRREYKRVFMHRIDGGPEIARYMASTRLNADWGFFQRLRDLGRRATSAWLDAHYADIGTRSTLDVKAATG